MVQWLLLHGLLRDDSGLWFDVYVHFRMSFGSAFAFGDAALLLPFSDALAATTQQAQLAASWKIDDKRRSLCVCMSTRLHVIVGRYAQ